MVVVASVMEARCISANLRTRAATR